MDRATYGMRDASFSTSKALPNGASTVYSSALDLGELPVQGARHEPCEAEISAPALATGELGDADTMKYDVQTATEPTFASPTTIAKEVLVQTGAGGVGAAAAKCRQKIATTSQRYIRVAATNSAAGDCSGKTFGVALLF